MSIDIIGNFLTVIRNAIARSKPSVTTSYSKLKHELALVLQEEYIANQNLDNMFM